MTISPGLSYNKNPEAIVDLKGKKSNAPAVRPEVRRKSLLLYLFMVFCYNIPKLTTKNECSGMRIFSGFLTPLAVNLVLPI
jgi:hypothetical protein